MVDIARIKEHLERAKVLLADHDEHFIDCNCAFCEATDEVAAALIVLRKKEGLA